MCDSHSPVEHIVLRMKPVFQTMNNVTPSVSAAARLTWYGIEPFCISFHVSLDWSTWCVVLWFCAWWGTGQNNVIVGNDTGMYWCKSGGKKVPFIGILTARSVSAYLMKLRKWQWNLFQSDQWIQECNHGKRCQLLPVGISARNVLAKFL